MISEDGVLQLLLTGDIGCWSDITYQSVLDAVNSSHSQKVEVIINSYGGEVYEALAIHNLLSSINAETTIMGIAASAAGVIAQSGKVRKVYPHSRLMIHRVYSGVFGDPETLQNVAHEALALETEIQNIYSERCKKPKEYFENLFKSNQEFYFNGSECIKEGFADLLLPTNFILQIPNNLKSDKDYFEFFNNKFYKNMNQQDLISLIKSQQKALNLLTAKVNKIIAKNSIEKTTVDGATIYIDTDVDGEFLGKQVYTTDEQGNMTPLANGEYQLADGIIIIVTDGIITEVKQAEASTAVIEEIENLKKENQRLINLLEGKIDAAKKPASNVVKSSDASDLKAALKNFFANKLKK